MKKIVIFLATIILILCIFSSNNIPNESIRFRVIAENNNEEAQVLKQKIVLNLKNEINKIETQSSNIINSRKIIKKELPTINRIIEETIKESGMNKKYNIKYGLNYFPTKKYQGKVYEEGEYESLVITIEEGQGENFWCVLFPPLCLIEPNEIDEEVEYTSIIKEFINKYF